MCKRVGHNILKLIVNLFSIKQKYTYFLLINKLLNRKYKLYKNIKMINYRGKKFEGYNKPKKSDKAGKKGMVLAKEGDKVKLIHFGDSSMGHNYSPEARKSFKARHGKNIAKGKMSAAWWADKVLWAGPGKSAKNPPSSQKNIKGK
jgi:hypothetical protein